VLTLDAAANTVTSQADFAALNTPVAFRKGPDGNLYVLSYGNGALYKYVFTPP
jgi:hypothetical protein